MTTLKGPCYDLHLIPYGPGIVRVIKSRGKPPLFEDDDIMLSPGLKPQGTFETKQEGSRVRLRLLRLQVVVDEQRAVTFQDADGNEILSERAVEWEEVIRQGQPTNTVAQRFASTPDESFFGLGQHQIERIDCKGLSLEMYQTNLSIPIPYVISSRGYGLLWHAFSYAAFGHPTETIPASAWLMPDGKETGLQADVFSDAECTKLLHSERVPTIDRNWDVSDGFGPTDPSIMPENRQSFSVRYTGRLKAPADGTYVWKIEFARGCRVWLDDRLVIDNRHQCSLLTARKPIDLEGGRVYAFRLECPQNVDWHGAFARLYWSLPQPPDEMRLWAEDVACLDYFFVYGPQPAQLIAGYRELTGQAPLMPRWAYGFWQSRERYTTQEQVLDVARTYRAKKIPIDAIVQDWCYWGKYQWGSHRFDEEIFPDPAGMVRTLNEDLNMRIMLSVWAEFSPATQTYRQFKEADLLLPNALRGEHQYYDAFSQAGRDLYWKQIKDLLYPLGFDAWWQDCTEPEFHHPSEKRDLEAGLHPNSRGTGSRYLNCYSTFSNRAVYDGFRATDRDRRCFILSRAGFAGQQRYASCIWSGDIYGTWEVLREQIACGVNTAMAGYPYWNSDIGGFFIATSPDDPGYRELFTRWFQFGAFTPVFRVHGTSHPKELWRFGPETEAILVAYDNLRYRLLPYIYSVAADVTFNHGLMMRGLHYDFPDDPGVHAVNDQFMFGPAIMVCPVTQPGAVARTVYLPAGAVWHDFWTGDRYEGGRSVEMAAPLDRLPLLVRGGGILPLGPFVQHSGEPCDPLEVRVYGGASGVFELYEDKGDGYGYEKGEWRRLSFAWNNAKGLLSVGPARGDAAVALGRHTVHAVRVRPGHGVGLDACDAPDACRVDDGLAWSLRL